MSGELAAGKMAFQNGNYSDAFEHLLPVAKTGRPEAEYAVGYMYYYGYGVQRDAVAGRFWIERAAAQHYALANQALDRMNHPTPENGASDTTGLVASGIKGEVVPSEAYTETPGPSAPKALPKPKKKPILKSPAVVSHKTTHACVEPPARYVLQLYGSWQLESARQFANEQKFTRPVRACRTLRDGKDWYILVTGLFATMEEAREAKAALPRAMKALNPWIRPARDLSKA